MGIESVGVWMPFVIAPTMFIWMASSYAYYTKQTKATKKEQRLEDYYKLE